MKLIQMDLIIRILKKYLPVMSGIMKFWPIVVLTELLSIFGGAFVNGLKKKLRQYKKIDKQAFS